MAPTPALIAVLVSCALLCGCTSTVTNPPSTSPAPPSSSTATPSSGQSASATPSSTWSAEQAAAEKAVSDYRAAIRPIASNPAAYSEAKMRAILTKVAGGDVVSANVGSYMSLKKRGFRYDGDATAVSTKVANAGKPAFGVEVAVTKCLDQRAIRVLDESGREVTESELGYSIPDFNLRQYTAIKRTGSDKFLVYGIASVKGECGP